MKTSCSSWVLALASLLFLVSNPALAHEWGLTKATLIEGKAGVYSLEASAPLTSADIYHLPILPKRCKSNFASGQSTGAGVRFIFECSAPLTSSDQLRLPWRRAGVLLTTKWGDGTSDEKFFTRKGSNIVVNFSALTPGSGGLLAAANRYAALGVEHILFGYDHLLFVFALMLLVRRPWMLVKTITAFTIAHSITLASALLHVVILPQRVIETAIVLSIVFVAVEVVRKSRAQTSLTIRYPWIVAFAFGLLHGFGFASALSEFSLPKSEFPVALLFFNIGVELGQLSFVVVILAAAGLLSRFAGWRSSGLAVRRIIIPDQLVIPGVYVAGSLASYWTLMRLLAPIV